MTMRIWRIGTRASPLALAQAHETRDRLMRAHGLDEERFDIVRLSTAGDRIQDRPLSEAGGKGLFTKEVDAALEDGRADIAVHSMKDVATTPPDFVAFGAILPREDVRDAFFSDIADAVDALPQGAVVGTASLRRQAQLKWRRPDLVTTLVRGNVQTRMQRLAEGAMQATFLAVAGLRRLGLEAKARSVMSADDMLPAAAQGAIGVACRADDAETRELLAPIHCDASALRIAAERAFLKRLDGSCRTPIAALAEVDGARLRFRGEILRPDGSERHAVSDESAATIEAAEAMGARAAEAALTAAGDAFWDAVRRAAL